MLNRTPDFTSVLVAALLAAATATVGPASSAEPAAGDRRPNFLVVVTDDLGYSDLGAFGGEIETPNLDALAYAGVRFTGFHTAPTCSPTRSMLLTGRDHHEVGLGTMAETLTPHTRGRDGYEGHLSRRAATAAELLRDAGYRTFMSGKWHLGLEEDQSPAARGFERSFALLQGVHNHFGADQDDAWKEAGGAPTYREDGKLSTYPTGAYAADYFADRLIGYLRDGRDDPRPFFAYLTFTQPHWPLQAPDELVAKYKGRYHAGPQALREERLRRLKAQGLIPPDAAPHATEDVPEWSGLTPEQRAYESRKMEVYAAMVDRIDQNVGRVVGELKASGRLENTVVVFLSDNGPEAGRRETPHGVDDPARQAALRIDNRTENVGRPSSYAGYGPDWAQAAAAPSRLYKSYTTEGGTRTPAFVAGPGVRGGRVAGAFLHVKDVTPTLLDLAGVEPQDRFQDRPVLRPEGHSWAGLLAGDAERVYAEDEAVGWELFYRRALRRGDWKVTYLSADRGGAEPARWELFDLRVDPGETTDLAGREPDRLRELVAAWEAYAARVGVVPPPSKVAAAEEPAAGRPPSR